MAVTRRTLQATPEQVWAVIADGFTYCHWVVGTSIIRDVDAGFPAVGTALHYRVGRGPLSMDGHTEVHAVEPRRSLRLEAHGWPAGSVDITVTLTGHADATEVAIAEVPARGPAARLHNPAFDRLTQWRNMETLRRLDRLVRRRAAETAPDDRTEGGANSGA